MQKFGYDKPNVLFVRSITHLFASVYAIQMTASAVEIVENFSIHSSSHSESLVESPTKAFLSPVSPSAQWYATQTRILFPRTEPQSIMNFAFGTDGEYGINFRNGLCLCCDGSY